MDLDVAAAAIAATAVLPRIAARRTALLLIHWQHDVVAPDSAFGAHFAEQVARSGAVPRVAGLLAAARAAGALPVHVTVAYAADHADNHPNSPVFAFAAAQRAFVPGGRGGRVIDEVAPRPGDLVVPHGRISGFSGTALDHLLRVRGIDTVLVTGVATNVAVEGTARTAVDLGYATVVVEDCCVAAAPATHAASVASMRAFVSEVAPAGRVVAALGRGQ